VVISPWSDHALEPYDPYLVGAAVDAACAAVGKAAPTAPTRWRWRLVGIMFGVIGALLLGDRLPHLFPRLLRVRGPLLASIAISVVALASGAWLGAAPIPRRIPVQLAITAVMLLVVMGGAKLRAPRWSFLALAALFAICCAAMNMYFLALLGALCTLVLFAGTVVGWIAARDGTRRDGDIAFAVLVGYALGQWVPMNLPW
jgi:hypothetical protein